MTEEQLRAEIAAALIRASGDDETTLYQWHPCLADVPCPARQQPARPCPCAGSPYLSDEAWAQLRPIITGIQRAAAT